MPEGDTIRRLAERINRRFAGERCQRCVTRDPRLVHVDFAGAVLREADARGKHLLIRFDDGRTLFAHLRMDGSFTVGPAATRAGVAAAGRAVDGGRPAHRRRRAGARRRRHGRRGPTSSATSGPTSAARRCPTSTRSLERMAERPDEPLAGALLDQRNVAGFGNVYAVELPFVAGVSPNQPVGTVDGLAELLGLGRGGDPHQRRPWPAEHDRPAAARRRPLDLRPPRPPVPAVRRPRLDGWDERDSPWRRVADVVPDVPADRTPPGRRRRPGPPPPRPPPGPARPTFPPA